MIGDYSQRYDLTPGEWIVFEINDKDKEQVEKGIIELLGKPFRIAKCEEGYSIKVPCRYLLRQLNGELIAYSPAWHRLGNSSLPSSFHVKRIDGKDLNELLVQGICARVAQIAAKLNSEDQAGFKKAQNKD